MEIPEYLKGALALLLIVTALGWILWIMRER